MSDPSINSPNEQAGHPQAQPWLLMMCQIQALLDRVLNANGDDEATSRSELFMTAAAGFNLQKWGAARARQAIVNVSLALNVAADFLQVDSDGSRQ